MDFMEYKKCLSFPGFGIEPFYVDRVAFTLFGKDVYWYGVLITIGMILAVVCALWLAKHERIKSDDIYDLALWVIIFGVLGARAYYVIFDWDPAVYLETGGNFFQNAWGTFVNCLAMWDGGLAIYGGVIAGLLTGFIFAKIKKIEFLKLFDILAACVLIGQVIGRWGNFINIEVYGAETTAFTRMGIHLMNSEGHILAEMFVHPMFLYESVWNLVGLVIVLLTYKKKKFNGQIFCFYLVWYGFGRMILEGMRDPEYNLMIGNSGIMVSQLVGFISLVIGIALFVLFFKRSKKVQSEAKEYNSLYSGNDNAPENAAEETSEEATEETLDTTPTEE
ncbi:MAG: prolipoprotein diacylglyceryl transferase [Ruminococcaceae bacterium]|nr:prolipoprotein diacylglyceryl transferase [Oscillospiraceae bacterium]